MYAHHSAATSFPFREMFTHAFAFTNARNTRYMRSMYEVLEATYRDESKKMVLVLDDDALFTCNFEYDFAKLLAEPR